MAIFVDVDDTLVLFDGKKINPYGVINGKPYKPNLALIEKLKNTKEDIIVWSGGGRDYAKMVAIKVLPEEIRFMVGDKVMDMQSVKSGDIIIDDQKENFVPLEEIGVYVFNPFEEWIFNEED